MRIANYGPKLSFKQLQQTLRVQRGLRVKINSVKKTKLNDANKKNLTSSFLKKNSDLQENKQKNWENDQNK